jgi:eukaryotic-like serine/threonine-protein kinase
MPVPTDTLPPRYRDPEHIGSGGMGEIFRATDQDLGRVVAVKVLAERYAQDDGLRRRFKREALAAARLSGNPNIVTIFDVDEHNGRPLIVMEYLSGGTLEERAAGPSPPSQVLDWLGDAASALDAAHEAGVVHRDVKPGNLIRDGRGNVQVADFGIATASGMESFTQAGTILGTAGYLSPEQARGERAGAASDRYALAVVAWELLTGRRPFQAESPTAEAAAHVTAPIPSVHAENPAVPAAFDPVFQRALAKDPDARYPTAAEFVGELRRALHDDAGDTWIVRPRPATAATRVAVARPGGSRWWIPALVALLVAAGILAAVLYARGGDEQTATQPGPRTIVKTVTSQGTTVHQTVTAQPPPATTAATSGASGSALNDAGYSKIQAGDLAGALPLLEQAVQKLSGTGSTTEAYADYNLAYTRYRLGDCTDIMTLLDRSQSIQGRRKEIDRLQKAAEKHC